MLSASMGKLDDTAAESTPGRGWMRSNRRRAAMRCDLASGYLVKFRSTPTAKTRWGTKPGIDALQLDQAVDHQAGANQQHVGKGHLRGNQRAAHQAARWRAGRIAGRSP